MPIRDRLRRAFGREKSGSSEDLTPKRTRSQKADLYKVGEPMPTTKYPGRYDRPHQDLLRAFSFGDAWNRRSSYHTDVSPRGSKPPSRRSSWIGGRRSTSHVPSNVAQLVENANDESDVHNVGQSRRCTTERDPRQHEHDPDLRQQSQPSRNPPDTHNENAHFSDLELSQVLSRTDMQAAAPVPSPIAVA